jgi:ABC-type hemin transport system ATPase subunit
VQRTAEGFDAFAHPGHVVGLVGPNGAGKSTLPQLARGRIGPTSGTLSVFGSRPAANAAHLAGVGFVAQHTPVYASFSIADHLKMGAGSIAGGPVIGGLEIPAPPALSVTPRMSEQPRPPRGHRRPADQSRLS